MCDYQIETCLSKQRYKYICGIDEVGRGSLFGPVVAGAVILDPEKLNPEINDSKKLSPRKREELALFIYENAIDFSLGWCWNDEIDQINILQATKRAMKMAVNKLHFQPDYVLIDGMEPDFLKMNGQGLIKGDSKSMSIAAASIIAKVFRDNLLGSFLSFFPDYELEKNKGYPSPSHIKKMSQKGITVFHRRSFKVKKWPKTN